jgi:hypothetical protein
VIDESVHWKAQSPLQLEAESIPFKEVSPSARLLCRAVQDHYRCPEGFFDFVLSGEVSAVPGYFRFGPDITCYGRSSGAIPEAQFDSLSGSGSIEQAGFEQGRVSLPFDPTEVIDNLRLERYADPDGMGTGGHDILRKIYYLLRPFTNLAMRRQVQKFRARNWQERAFPRWPVDTTVENLSETLLRFSLEAKGVESVPFVWFWPQRARGCMIMTHDVETAAGRDFCGELMDMDDVYGIKASFQIVPEKRYEVPRKFLDTISQRGFEIEVQDLNHDGRLFDDREEFLRRAALINRYAVEYGAKGFRAAVLYRKPAWYDALDFSFDMSIPNVGHLDPQSGGCCTVTPYFIGDILELPVTTVQDYTLFHILNQRSIDLWKVQVDLILEKHGLASFIVHPDYIIEPETQSAYRELLGYLQSRREKNELWCALPQEVDRWWRDRSKMTVVKHGDSWGIEGEGAESATLAYARNLNGRLVYEMAGSACTWPAK